jgi:hypothetical protein
VRREFAGLQAINPANLILACSDGVLWFSLQAVLGVHAAWVVSHGLHRMHRWVSAGGRRMGAAWVPPLKLM